MIDEETDDQRMSRLKAAGFDDRLPEEQEEADAVDELVTKEMASLSLHEHDKAAFDVHGLSEEIEETPTLISESLKALETEIRKIRFNRSSYERAKLLNPGYVNDRDFLLMFLRSEHFDCKKAAKRLFFHFQHKEELFGSGEVLGRDVRLSDLNADDLKWLETGAMQFLSNRDNMGRPVFVFIHNNRQASENEVIHMVRLEFSYRH